jgi:flagellar M-ring protein FliF
MNASFIIPKIEDLPEIPIWEQPWLQGLVKQVLGGIFVIIILLMIVRPLIKALTSRTLLIDDEGNQVDSSGNLVESTSDNASANANASAEGEGQPLLVNNSNHSELNNLLATTADSSYEDKLEFARLMIQDDPSRVANVVKEWVANNG